MGNIVHRMKTYIRMIWVIVHFQLRGIVRDVAIQIRVNLPKNNMQEKKTWLVHSNARAQPKEDLFAAPRINLFSPAY